MAEQFFTTCRKCGRQILMTRNIYNKYWIPCDPEILRYKPAAVSSNYVTPEGIVVSGKPDRDGEFGYRLHRRTCKA